MKYESTILKRLIDTYGVVGNPRYISEIIKEFIVRGKECFPNLFTYQSDWLAHIDEFGLNPSYTVSYTGQSIYAPNTLERPVKSAILKGNTGYRDIDTGEILETFEEGRNLELVSVKMPVLKATGKNLFDMKQIGEELNNFNPIIIGNDSLTITSSPLSHLYNCRTINFKSNTQYTLSANIESDSSLIGTVLGLRYTDGSFTYISKPNQTLTSDANKTIECIEFSFGAPGIEETWSNIQLEEGSVATSYEPFKSNILTVNKDVELGSVGKVKDELNLLTGQLTHRTAARAYQKGDESNSEVLTDMTNTRYKLPKEVIKTVDLTIHDKDQQKVERLTSFEGGTHFTTSSQDGSLLPTLSVDVVTDLEETLKICSLEGNTM